MRSFRLLSKVAVNLTANYSEARGGPGRGLIPLPLQSERLKLLVIADDLTGTLEAAAILAGSGAVCRLQISPSQPPPPPYGGTTEALVVNLNTRHVPPDEAHRSILEFVERHRGDYDLVYKKTDSTLRGNIVAELNALSSFGPIMFVPAYPELGRTVKHGKLLVDNHPIEQTEFATDPLHPCLNGDVAGLFRVCSRVSVYDAADAAGMDLLAGRWLHERGFAAGPCGLLRSLVRLQTKGHTFVSPAFSLRRVLVLCGSLHIRSREQLQNALALFESGLWTLVSTSDELKCNPRHHAMASAGAAACRFERETFDACIVFGGDTAMAFLEALRLPQVNPLGEVYPGIAVCSLPDRRILITKAGGFGPPSLLQLIHERFGAGHL